MDHLNNHPFINPSTLDMLRTNTRNDPGFLTELFESFIEDTTELLELLYQNVEERQLKDYSENIHTLKGLSGTIGCSRMFELLKIMDTHNKDDDFERSKKYLNDLTILFEETTLAIKTEILNTAS